LQVILVASESLGEAPRNSTISRRQTNLSIHEKKFCVFFWAEDTRSLLKPGEMTQRDTHCAQTGNSRDAGHTILEWPENAVFCPPRATKTQKREGVRRVSAPLGHSKLRAFFSRLIARYSKLSLPWHREPSTNL
jgi:hypothetical protein